MATEKEKFASRLNEALDDVGIPKIGQGRQSALAKLCGVPPQQAGRWLKGEDFPKTSKLVKMAQTLGVRSNWLLSGAGSKELSEAEQEAMRKALLEQHHEDEPETGADEPNVQAGMLDQEAFELAVVWMQLPDAQREALKKVIYELSRSA